MAYFLVILPLPAKELVAHYTSSQAQLELGRFIKDILVSTSIKWNELGSYLSFFKSPTVYTVLFNLVLTMPFGVYLRYYYKKKWYHVLFLTFFLSLFFELTQLSGLYGIYPRSYRLFDVDDLLINTIGGMIGFLIAPLIMHFLPSREHLDEKAFTKGQTVSLTRRGFAYFIDFVFMMSVTGLCAYFIPQFEETGFLFGYYLISAGVLFLLFPLLFEGRTIGKIVLKLRLVTQENQKPSWYQILTRYLFCHFILLPTPYYLILLGKLPLPKWMLYLFQTIIGINYLLFLLSFLLVVCGKRKSLSYENISNTKNESVFVKEKKEIIE